jgi:hypothetical protein
MKNFHLLLLLYVTMVTNARKEKSNKAHPEDTVAIVTKMCLD